MLSFFLKVVILDVGFLFHGNPGWRVYVPFLVIIMDVVILCHG